ncbi:MAG: ABC transporter permease [Candidatus Krumholzibacteriia bacterium]
MSKVWIVVRKEYLERVRSKSFIIGTVLGPALMSLLIVLPMLLSNIGSDEQRTIGVIDPAGRYFEPLRGAVRAQGSQNLELVLINCQDRALDDCVQELQDKILGQALHSGIVVSPDFVDSRTAVFYNRSVSALVVRDEVLRPALNNVLREMRMASAGVPDTLHAYLVATTDWSSRKVTAEGAAVQNEAVSFAMAFILIMIIYFMVLMYGSHTLMAVVEEKGSRMVEVLLASVPPHKLMLGKVLGIGLAGLTQFAIWTIALVFVSAQGIAIGGFQLDTSVLTPTILASFVVFFLLGFFLYATLYAGIGAMCNTAQESQQFQTPLAIGLVLPMTLLTLVLSAPDSTASVVLSLIPLFSPVLMFMRVVVQTPPLWQIVLSWLLMIASIWLAARVAGRLFRAGILMYGAAPTWASLGRALRS